MPAGGGFRFAAGICHTLGMTTQLVSRSRSAAHSIGTLVALTGSGAVAGTAAGLAAAEGLLMSAGKFLREQAAVAWRSWEFYVSVGTAASAEVALSASDKLRESSVLPNVLVGYSALGVGVAAIVLTALAIVVASLGEDFYADVLERAGGVDDALEPFKHVAYVSAVAVIMGGASLLAWEFSEVLRPEAFAIATLFAVWSALGSVGLVSLVAFHGVQRGKLALDIRRTRESLSRIEKGRRASGE